jgi:hypothetical protein
MSTCHGSAVPAGYERGAAKHGNVFRQVGVPESIDSYALKDCRRLVLLMLSSRITFYEGCLIVDVCVCAHSSG